MSAKSPVDELNRLASRFERHAETLRRIQELVQDDPDLAPLIVAALNGAGAEKPYKTRVKRINAHTHLDTVVAFFDSQDNAWATTSDIQKATGISRGALGAVLHGTHKERFKKKAKPGDRKTKLWRLRKEVI